ncbi:MAG: chlorite dismutase family protein [Elusimicrobiota bacterium]
MKLFSIFTFVRLLNKFKMLEQNEKITLKQDFENMLAGCQEKIFLRTYFVSGLKEDCDILFWRMHPSLDYLQDICAKTFAVGIGKYMEIRYTYIGVKEFKIENIEELNSKIGIYPYFLLHPLNKSFKWYELSEEERNNIIEERKKIFLNYNKILENFFVSFGIDDQDMIVTREAADINVLVQATAELKKQKSKSFTIGDKPVFLCIGKDLREILDNIS